MNKATLFFPNFFTIVRPNLSPCPSRTVSVPFYVFLTVPFFTASATVTEPLILTIRFLVFDREPYRPRNGDRCPFFIKDQLLTVRLKNGTARHIKRKTDTIRRRYGTSYKVRYGHVYKFGHTFVSELC